MALFFCPLRQRPPLDASSLFISEQSALLRTARAVSLWLLRLSMFLPAM